MKKTTMLMLCLCLALGCAGAPEPQQFTAPELSAESQDALEFWRVQGQGSVGQHAMVVVAEGEAMRVVSVDFPETWSTWNALFELPAAPTRLSVTTSMLNQQLFDRVAATVRQRINDELGGTEKFQKPIQTELALSSGRTVDVSVVGSALAVFAHEMTAEERGVVIDTLVFAQAGARAKAKKDNDAKAYEKSFSDTVSHLGWVVTQAGAMPLDPLAPVSTSLASLSQTTEVFEHLSWVAQPAP